MVAISAAPAGVKDEAAHWYNPARNYGQPNRHGSIPEIIDVIKARLSDS